MIFPESKVESFTSVSQCSSVLWLWLICQVAAAVLPLNFLPFHFMPAFVMEPALHENNPVTCIFFPIRWKTTPGLLQMDELVSRVPNAWRRPHLRIGNVNRNWSEFCLNLRPLSSSPSSSCPLTGAPTICTLLALNSALNWKQYWAPGL